VVSEQEYLDFARRYPTAESRQAQQGRLDLKLILADGTTYPQSGRFDFANRQVDVRTGAIQLAALFPNPTNTLRPGQYGRVRTATRVQTGALLVPQRAVNELQGSYQIAVVDKDDKVNIRTVMVGDRVGNQWLINDGLHPGERVVAEGLQRVRQGLQVTPKAYGTK
jgi:membrane fusion protein (multidrug efflux system)